MPLMRWLFITSFWLLGIPALAEDIRVFAAASMQTALDEAIHAWTELSGVEVNAVYAGSATLARQIDAGAPADIFISASAEWMNYVEDNDFVEAGTRRDFLTNRLVVIGALDDAPVALENLGAALGQGLIAMGDVSSVPAGVYAKQSLEHFGIWASVRSQAVETSNVRRALLLVALGEVPRGIVYATDALAEPSVSVLLTLPADSHVPIVYPVAVLRGHADGAEDFLNFMIGPGQAAFIDAGFGVVR